MIVTLKREAKNLHGDLEGIYVLRTEIINGKSHWVHESGFYAIWYGKQPSVWVVGDLNDLGSPTGWIISYDDVASPQEATTWEYYIDDNIEFVESNDILVDALPGTGTSLIGRFLGPRKNCVNRNSYY